MQRLTMIPAAGALALLAAAASLGACKQQRPDNGSNAAESPAVLPSVPRPQPPLDRAAILAAVAKAASVTAAGAPMPNDLRSLDGKQFELRIRFGCRGQSDSLEKDWLGWSFDAKQRTLRVRAKPTISEDEPLIAKLGGDAFEAVEGFWIPRPWLLQPVCPAAEPVERPISLPVPVPEKTVETPAVPEAVAAEPVPQWPRIGIAQYFSSEDPRTRRRDGRPYQAVHSVPEGTKVSAEGFNLVLSGRLRALPGQSAINCAARNPTSPPECVVSVEFQRVWIEQPASGETIAEWSGG